MLLFCCLFQLYHQMSSSVLFRSLCSVTDHRLWPGAARVFPQRHASVPGERWHLSSEKLHYKSLFPGMEMQRESVGLSCRKRKQAESQWLAVGEATAVLLVCWTRCSLCPETSVNQQPLAPQSGVCSFRRMPMRCNLLLSTLHHFLLSCIMMTVWGTIPHMEHKWPQTELQDKECEICLKLMSTFAGIDLSGVINAGCRH